MILVVGATGNLGGLITRKLLERGQDVRILVRANSSYHELADLGAQPVFGDLKEPATLRPACDGIDVLITTANSAARGGDDNPRTVDLEGNHHLIASAKSAGVRQFIFTSAHGSNPDSPLPFLQAKGRTEVDLRESGIPYTILAPTPFMDVWIPMIVGMPFLQGQPITLIGKGDRKHSFIAAADVAAFAVAAIHNNSAINQHLVLGGPEGVSWRDIVAAVERVTGRTVSVRTVPIGESLPVMPDFVTGLMTFMATADDIIPMTDLARTFNVQQTTLEQFVHQAFGSPTEQRGTEQ